MNRRNIQSCCLDVFDVRAADGELRGQRPGGVGHRGHDEDQQEGAKVREEEDQSCDGGAAGWHGGQEAEVNQSWS